MLISIIIIKLIINLFNIVILLFLFILGLCFKTENLFGAQFGELEKMYINSHEKHCIFLIRVTTFIDEHLRIIPSKILYTEEDPHEGSKHLYM